MSFEPGGRCVSSVLIADADWAYTEKLVEDLRQQGMWCVGTFEVESALAKLRDEDFDLLMCDTAMPGNENLELVRSLPKDCCTSTILTASHPTIDSAIGSLSLNIVAYLVKPIDPKLLKDHVAVAIRRCRTLRQAAAARRHAQETLEQLAAADASAPGLRGDVLIDEYLRLSASNIASSVLDMVSIAGAITSPQTPRAACHLFSCRRLAELTGAIQQTVDVLEKTKHAFKSRDLGDLRRRLEQLVGAPSATD